MPGKAQSKGLRAQGSGNNRQSAVGSQFRGNDCRLGTGNVIGFQGFRVPRFQEKRSAKSGLKPVAMPRRGQRSVAVGYAHGIGGYKDISFTRCSP